MDNVIKTTQNAYENYFNSLRRFGNITKQDKYKLLVLWFFYHLKYKCDFLYKSVADENGKRTWEVDRQLESEINKKFMSQLNCLTNASCFIKLSPYNDCTPIAGSIWFEDVEHILQFLVTNATNLIVEHNVSDLSDYDKLKELLWVNGSGIMTEHGSTEDDMKFLNINEERNE